MQGTDYAYTLQGWLKGINGDRLNPTTDMGRDGDATVVGNPNLLTGRDAYALSLGYYGDNDYKAIASSYDNDSPANIAKRPFAPIGGVGTMNTEHTPLYNGNIAHTVNTLQHFGLWDATNGDQGQVLAMVYRYDQLNRLRTARGIIGLGNTNTWNTVADAATNRYRSEYTYDANGNIETAQRWNATGAARYDSLHYHYHDAGGRRLRNRLYHLQDLAADGVVTAPDPDDLKKTTLAFDTNLGTLNTNASTNNYRYDALGNLVYDNREGITNIDWTVAGKVRSVAKATGPSLAFAYGASGQRTQKQVGDPATDPTAYREHYIRDAQGNIMATYRYTNNAGASLKLNERPVYGSSRLGSLRKEVELHTLASFDPASANPVQMVDLNYELTDHLGNVCAVVTGRLLDGNGGGTAKQAELVSAQGYEPFGSLLPGRNYNSGASRHLFQGQEHDDEVNDGVGTSYAFKYRIHDPRIGRFLSLDPLASKYPFWTPYAFSGNRVIDAFEFEGLEPVYKSFTYGSSTVPFWFISDERTPQKFRIEGGDREFDFACHRADGKHSLALVQSRDCCQRPDPDNGTASHDVNYLLDAKIYVRGQQIPVLTLLRAAMNQNPDLKLAIIGNHMIPSQSMNKEGLELYSRDQINAEPRLGDDFTRLRADFVRRYYFGDFDNVDTYSRNDVNARWPLFPSSVSLPDLGLDSRGITLLFDFRGVQNTPRREAESAPVEPNTIYRNVRFL